MTYFPLVAEKGWHMGYAAPDSAQTLAGDIWFGNWADLVIASWGGLDILVDPYTESTSGAVRVTAFQDTDVICRHEQSFARGGGVNGHIDVMAFTIDIVRGLPRLHGLCPTSHRRCSNSQFKR